MEICVFARYRTQAADENRSLKTRIVPPTRPGLSSGMGAQALPAEVSKSEQTEKIVPPNSNGQTWIRVTLFEINLLRTISA